MIRMNDSTAKTTLKAAALVSVFLLCVVAMSFGQQQVNLTAGPATTTMPDGTVIPMWGYSCGAAVSGSTATCAPLNGTGVGGMNPNAAMGALGGVYVLNGGSGYSPTPTVTISDPTGTIPGVTNVTAMASAVVSGGQIVGFNVTKHGAGYITAPTVTITDSTGTGASAAASPAWSPVLITVPYGTTAGGLQINLTNNLSFTGAANIPTSIVIIGQVGGGLGSSHTTAASPDHSNAQGCPSWFIAANPPGTPCTAANNQGLATPPTQAPRVQSMATEVLPGTTATSLTWQYLKPGTYLLESGTHPSIQVPMGLIGMLVVTSAPTGTGTTSATLGTAYPQFTSPTAASQAAVPAAVQYNAELPVEFSEIDPVQNKAVDIAVRNPNFSETRVWSGLPTDPQGGPGCGNPASGAYYQSCYPPAVNYTPFYYLINGLAFNKTNPGASLLPATAGVSGTTPVTMGITGTVLVRMVNAGLRMHVPAIVGSQTTGFNGGGTASTTVNGFTLIAEDGNPLPNLAAPRVQTDVFMAAGKTYDVMVNVPSTTLPIYDRELSLSANSSVRDAGMLAYLSVNGSLLPI